MKNCFLKFSTLALSALVLASCGSESVEPTPDVALDTIPEVVETPEEPEEIIDLDDVDLPTPLQMANLLNKAGLSFQADLTNDADNADKYVSFYQRVANFGVYSADLSYCSLNEQAQDALIYLQTIGKLSDQLGFSSILNTAELIENFESNISDQNAMHDLIGEMEDNLEDYTDMNETKYILPVLFAGGWLESTYLGTKSIENQSNEELQKELIKQMMILDNLILGLKANPEKEDIINGLITDLEAIKEIYQSFDFIQNVDSEEEPTVSQEDFERLADKIQDVRNNLVTP